MTSAVFQKDGRGFAGFAGSAYKKSSALALTTAGYWSGIAGAPALLVYPRSRGFSVLFTSFKRKHPKRGWDPAR